MFYPSRLLRYSNHSLLHGKVVSSAVLGLRHQSSKRPWYLNIANGDTESDLLSQQQKVSSIAFPEGSPESLKKIVTMLQDKLGLQDILIFDLRGKANFTSSLSNFARYMIICTAQSNKHCYKGFIELNRFLKLEFSAAPHVEGNMNNRLHKKQLQKLSRRSNLSKSWGSSVDNTSFKDTGSWYMIECNVDETFVNILTPQRRKELNLEELYAPENEKEKYRLAATGTPNPSQLELEKEDDNILSGLRRIAMQNRRYYSTVVSKPFDTTCFKTALMKQDIKHATELASKQNDSESSLSMLTTMLDTLSANKYRITGGVFPTTEWIECLNVLWPLYIPSHNEEELWSIRLKILLCLHLVDPKFYTLERVVNDFFVFKKQAGFKLTKTDIQIFLKLVLYHQERLTSKMTYKKLYHDNQMATMALKCYNNTFDDAIAADEEVLVLSLRTMYDKRSGLKLQAFYETIEYLLNNFASNHNVIVAIIQALVDLKDWDKLFQVWEVKISGVSLEHDQRPWTYFIKSILDLKDISVTRKLVDNGHLLWLKRNKVKITPELHQALKSLFETIDPDNLAFTELKQELLVTCK